MNVRPRHGTPVWSDGGTHIDEDLARIAEEVAEIVEKVKTIVNIPQSQELPNTHNEERTPRRSNNAVREAPLRKILVVDDDLRFRDVVKFDLKDMNVDLSEANSVREAKRFLEEDKELRVVLLDLDFPSGESGTALLEFIKDRASYYRVIILTGHDELLAAEQASSYNVFSYLSKVGGDAPRQMLRFAVTRAFDDLKREVSAKFDEIVLRRYPTPFIHIYQQIKSDLKPLEKLVTQKDMLELLVHFSALVVLCEYLNSEARSDELDQHIRKRIHKPALGDWFNIVNEIAKRLSGAANMSFLKFFLEFFTGRNKKILSDFINIRNKYVGHGTKHSDYENLDIVNKCDEWIESLLQEYQFVTQFLLCYVLSAQIIRGKYLYSIKECVGSNTQLLNSTRPLNMLLNTNEMCLVNPTDDLSLSLHPFIILDDCLECKQSEIFFYSKFSNGDLHYSSYKTGHWIVKKQSATEFLELIGD